MLALLTTAAALAGPWVRPAGEGYLRVGYDHFASEDATVNGVSTGLAWSSHSLGVYTEWGLGHRLQVVGSLPLTTATQTSVTGTVWRHSWSGDLRLELDGALLRDRPVALGAEVRIPTYRDPADYLTARGMPNELVTAYATSFPQLGDSNIDLTVKLLAGQSLGRGWLAGELGPRLRFGGFASGLHAAASGGWWAVPDRAALGLWSSLALRAPWIEPARATRQEWVVLGQVMVASPEQLPNWTLEMRGGGVVWAESAARGWTVGLGASWTRKEVPR